MIPKVFESEYADELLSAEATPDLLGRVSHLGAVVVPGVEEFPFPSQAQSVERACTMFTDLLHQEKSMLLVFVQSSLVEDTKLWRHLGASKDVAEYPALAKSISCQDVIKNESGWIRHVAVVDILVDRLREALEFISWNQRSSFLLFGDGLEQKREAVLRCVLPALDSFVEEKTIGAVEWVGACATLCMQSAVVTRSVGWLEEGCEFRFLCIGATEALHDLER